MQRVNEQVRCRPGTKWIRPRFAVSSEIEPREVKELDVVMTTVPTVAVVAAPVVIAEGVSAEVVAVDFEAAVVDAKGFVGRSCFGRDDPRRAGAAGGERSIGRSLHFPRHRAGIDGINRLCTKSWVPSVQP